MTGRFCIVHKIVQGGTHFAFLVVPAFIDEAENGLHLKHYNQVRFRNYLRNRKKITNIAQ